MKIQEIKVDKLIPYEFNNKKHDETQINRLANSIKEFWFIQPIVIDKNNIVIIWHWRLEWAKKLWLETVPCVKAETLTDEQVRKLRVLDNKLNESERDIENLQYDLSTIPNFNIWDLEISVDELFDDLFPEAPEEKEIVDVSVRPQKEAKLVKRWDIFELWNHRLMCWDSTDENDVDLLCAWTMIDIAFTSPPYNAWKDVQRVSAHHEKWKTIRAETTKYMNSNDDKDEEEYRKFLSEFTENSCQNLQKILWNIVNFHLWIFNHFQTTNLRWLIFYMISETDTPTQSFETNDIQHQQCEKMFWTVNMNTFTYSATNETEQFEQYHSDEHWKTSFTYQDNNTTNFLTYTTQHSQSSSLNTLSKILQKKACLICFDEREHQWLLQNSFERNHSQWK